MKERGFGYIEIVIVLAVVAVEKIQQDRPLARTKLAADQATLTSVQGLVRSYQAEKGQYPPDKATVVGLLVSPPRFQCAGNDFEYDPATGTLSLTITDDSRC